ncbi:hypothetical protein MMC11_000091 [Xylographa trunciseda]|nr:hypothetical protein [Xylographa trunciseda]
MSIRQVAFKSLTRPYNSITPPTPRLATIPQKTHLSTSNSPKSHAPPPRKPDPAPPSVEPSHPRFSLQDLGAGRGVRVVVIACLSVFATMETIFYVKVGWAYFYPPKEAESELKEK